MANKTTLIDFIMSFFAKDKDAYWFHHFTDEEKELRRMDAWQLAKTINEADVRHNTEKKIVAEHMLNVRLVRLQNRAVLVAAIFGAIGAAIGAYVTSLIQQPQKVERIYQHTATATPNDSAQNTGRIESKVSVYPKPIEPPNNAKANKDAENQKQP